VVPLLEVLAEALVVVEPPVRRAREEQELEAARDEVLEVVDRNAAVRGMEARVAAVVGLGVVRRVRADPAEELLVAAADDADPSVRRNDRRRDGPDALAKRRVLVVRLRRRLLGGERRRGES